MFEDEVLLLVALLEIELPDHTIRLCDGGFVDWPARGMFTAEDSIFGTIESAEGISEAISDEAPTWGLTLLPPNLSAAADLFQVDAQGSPALMWMAAVNRATGQLVGDPELLSRSQLDTVKVSATRATRKVEMSFVASAERLFMIMEGTAVTPRWHKALWPGEKGLDHVTGAQVAVPWGVDGPGRGTIFGISLPLGNLFNKGGG